MTLDQLHIFIAVAEREHVTRAADALGLAPPSVSAAVASLEREFGTKLFHRVGRGIVVTEGGKLLLDQARDLVNRAEALSYRDVEELAPAGTRRPAASRAARWPRNFQSDRVCMTRRWRKTDSNSWSHLWMRVSLGERDGNNESSRTR
jgi:DNA-binding transcriptional LysR family regulator